MKQSIVLFLAGLMLYGCGFDQRPAPQQPSAEMVMARANRVNGLVVFLESEPITPYRVLGSVDLAALKGMPQTEGRRVGEVLRDLGNNVVDNLTYSTKLDKLASQARATFPQAQAILIRGKLNQCTVITFNP